MIKGDLPGPGKRKEKFSLLNEQNEQYQYQWGDECAVSRCGIDVESKIERNFRKGTNVSEERGNS